MEEVSLWILLKSLRRMIFVEECEFSCLISNDISCSLHRELTQDGLDCGYEVGQLISEFLETTEKRDLRVLYYVKGLPTERDLGTTPAFWLNPVPEYHDTVNLIFYLSTSICFSQITTIYVRLCSLQKLLLTN